LFRRGSIVWRSRGCDTLTFDDGPSPLSLEILDILQQYRARATFFVVGEHVDHHPEIVRAEIAASSVVGNDTYTHPDLNELGSAEVLRELRRTQRN
jgi:peptidoglycan-N-acetylglucosamine deacetylase